MDAINLSAGDELNRLADAVEARSCTAGDLIDAAAILRQLAEAKPVARWRDMGNACYYLNQFRLADDAPLYTHAVPALPAAPVWEPIESAPKGRKLIVAYRNKLGRWRRVMAGYYPPQTLALDDDAHDDEGDGYAPEGWYEECESQETILPVEGKPEFFQELPSLASLDGDKGG